MADFNWVTARAQCSIISVFLRLKKGVQDDIEAANSVFKDTGREFRIVPDVTSFTVYQEIIPPRRESISFSLNDNNTEICVRDEGGTPKFSATVTLNKDKEYRLLVGNDEMEEWRFRQKALEKLFFS